MIAKHLDIAFAMGVVMSNLGKQNWEEVKGMMRYLRHTKSIHICYGSEDLSVKKGYIDSNPC